MNIFFWFVVTRVNKISWFHKNFIKKQSLLPINEIILIALKWCQTSEQRFLNKKCVSERRGTNTKLRSAVSFL